jgi:hypothetical protein
MRRRGQRGFTAAFVLLACWVAGLYGAGFASLHYDNRIEREEAAAVRYRKAAVNVEKTRCQERLQDCGCQERGVLQLEINPGLGAERRR